MSVARPARSRAARERRAGTTRLAGYLAVYRGVALALALAVAVIWIGQGNHAAGAVVAAALLYAAVITVARSMALAGRGSAAVILLNAIVWPLTLLGAVVSPSALPVSSMSALPAALMAVTELGRRSARRVLLSAGAVTGAVTVISRTIGVSGVESRTSDRVEALVLIALVPVLMALVSGIGWQNHQQLAEQADALASSRQRLIAAADSERRRVDSELRDGAQRRIEVAIGLLDAVSHTSDTAPPPDGRTAGPDPAEALARAQEELRVAIADLRRVVTRLRPAALSEHGLDPALRTAAAALVPDLVPGRAEQPSGSSSGPGVAALELGTPAAGVSVELDGIRRYADAVEGAVWLVSLDGLELVSRAAAASGEPARLVLRDEGDVLSLTITSGPVGPLGTERGQDPGPDLGPESGPESRPQRGLPTLADAIQALDDRLAAVDGWVDGAVEADPGHGDRLVIRALVPARVRAG